MLRMPDSDAAQGAGTCCHTSQPGAERRFPLLWCISMGTAAQEQEPACVEVHSTGLADSSEWMRVGSAVLRVVKKEVVLADRIIGFRQWGVLAYGQQAIDLLAAFEDELDEAWLQERLRREGSVAALAPLRTLARGDTPVTGAVLQDMLRQLRQRDSS